MPVRGPYNPNAQRIAEFVQNDFAKICIKRRSCPMKGAISQATRQKWRTIS